MQINLKLLELDTKQLSEIKKLLGYTKNIVITTHINPDGDAIGSSLALYHYLIKKGHTVNVIIPNNYPDFLSWMPESENIIIFNNDNKKKCLEIIDKADILFCLDFNDISRLDKLGKIVEKSNCIKILIDHHPEPKKYFDFIISKVDTSSTAELIYDFIIDLGDKPLITKTIAECIYVGIVTDTGSFSYSCNYEKTYLITAELIRLGVDGARIHNFVYDTFSENRLRLLGFCLSERLKVLKEYCTAYIYLTRKDLKKFNFQIGDTENIVNYALSLKGISLAALFTEKEAYVKISLRSKGNFSVNDFVRKYFKGGGHNKAAGGRSDMTLNETIKKFESVLPYCKDELNCNKNTK